MKKLLSVLLSLIILVASLPIGNFTVYAATSGTTGDCTWTLDGTVLTISGNGKMANYDTGMSAWSGVTDVIIEEGVTTIGTVTFWSDHLNSITIPASLTNIATNAFYYSSAKNVYITDLTAWLNIRFGNQHSNPLRLGGNLYLNNEIVTNLIIPEGTINIGSYAFYKCDSITDVTIPDSVANIGYQAFYQCYNLENVYISDLKAWCKIGFGYDSNPLIGAENLYLNGELVTNIVIPDGITRLNSCVFYGCDSLTSVIIPDSVTSIDSYAFSNCQSLANITIPNSVTSIGSDAFYNCRSIASITIPNSVTSIGDRAFYCCRSLTNITIGDGVTSIGSYAFDGCSSLTNITIPDSVKSIGSDAFYNCRSITSITIPNSVTSIGDEAFSYCSGLTSIVFGNGVTSIGDEAFSYCSGLTSVTIPDSVSSIGDEAFSYCSGLTSIVFGNGVTSIGNYAFRECIGLTSVTIPDSVSSIGYYAFSDCAGLTSVTIPDSVTSISYSIFWNSPNVVVKCNKNSYAHTYVVENNYKYLFINSQMPVLPNIESVSNNTITLTNVEGYEYSKDGVNWQTSSIFIDLLPFTDYIFYQRIASIGSYDASASSEGVAVKTNKNPNSYTPLKPGVDLITNNTVVLTATNGYEYSIDGIIWQKSNIFEGLKTFTEYSFYQRVAETTDTYASNTSSVLNITTLKNQITDTPAVPALANITQTAVTLISIDGYEYSKDGVNWQKSNVFENLKVNKTYTFYQRVAETTDTYAGAISDGLNVTTPKYSAPRPIEAVVKSKTANSITLNVANAYEYSKDGVNWQKSNVFSGLEPNTTYTIYQRIAETDVTYASNMSAGINVTTLKYECNITPSDPTLNYKTATTVTLNAIEGYEYSIDGQNWQTSNVFTNLQHATEHSFYQRIKETNTTYASGKSNALKVTTLKLECLVNPQKAVVESTAPGSLTLVMVDGYEYSRDGVNWQTSNTFTGLLPSTTYTFYQRIKETDTVYASGASEGLVVTLKAAQTAPDSPVILSFTESSVVLYEVNNVEYSKDGINWQNSNVFVDLLPATRYTFYQRFIASATHEVSLASDGTSVITDKSKQTLIPNAPTIQSVSSTSITLTHVEGCEYSINGTSWQTSNTFVGLECVTNYTFYQRYKETATTYAGKSSVSTTAKTDKGIQSAPLAPTLVKTTRNSVELLKIDGYEYSRDGINWQTSTVFKNLDPETNYMFYQRKAETLTHYASGKSASLIVKTDAEPLYTIGDIDGVEGITDRDAIHLLYHTFDPEGYPVNQECDFNGDGIVNDRDAIYLLYYIFAPEKYPLY